MMRSLYTAGSGMTAQQANVDVIANNMANVNTAGFKKSRTEFADLLYQTIKQPGLQSGPDSTLPTGIQLGSGVKQVATVKIYTDGPQQQTGNQLDVAIAGPGFFQVTLPDGTIGYTRDGSFKKDSTGRMVTSDGYPLVPNITFPTGYTNVLISADGTVSVSNQGQQQGQTLGQIQTATFINPSGLNSLGNNIQVPTAASGDPVVGTPGLAGTGELAQYYIEGSNVQVVEEMTNLIIAQRAYETNGKALTTSDTMLETANNLKAR